MVASLLPFLPLLGWPLSCLAAPGAAAGSAALLLNLVLVPSINGGAPGGALWNIALPPKDGDIHVPLKLCQPWVIWCFLSATAFSN